MSDRVKQFLAAIKSVCKEHQLTIYGDDYGLHVCEYDEAYYDEFGIGGADDETD